MPGRVRYGLRVRSGAAPLLLAGVVTGTLACDGGGQGAERAERDVVLDTASGAVAISLRGEPLVPTPLDSAARAHYEARLDSARAAYRADPAGADALIWVGRHLGYLGRYREAIVAFTEGIERHPGDARFYRHRGHRYITVRELDRARADLAHAARLTSGQADEVEPDGQPNEAGIPRSTLQTNIWYHLGLARYLLHDMEGAAHAFRRGLEISGNDDMRVAMADWLWLSLMRLGRETEAASVLAGIGPDMEILENEAYHRRLLLYKGEIPPDSLIPRPDAEPSDSLIPRPDAELSDSLVPRPEAEPPDSLAIATHGYGLGAWYLVNGDTVRARAEFERVLGTGIWPAFGYLAAEAELAALDAARTPAGAR